MAAGKQKKQMAPGLKLQRLKVCGKEENYVFG